LGKFSEYLHKAIVVIILLFVGYFAVINLPLNKYTKPLVRLVASQVGVKEPFVVDLIDKNIKKYYVKPKLLVPKKV
jgi:hypothetical protein